MKTRLSCPLVLGMVLLVALTVLLVLNPKPSPSSVSAVASAPPSQSHPSRVRENHQDLIGLRLKAATPECSTQWATKLSRNPDEYQQRLRDLKHAKKAEVIRFSTILDHQAELSTDRLPITLSLPGFDGKSIEVVFDRLKFDGPEGGTMAGTVVGSPETHVVIGFHQGETSGIIEGPNQLVFLDAFDQEVAILRELDPAAHAKDFTCDCMMHQQSAASAPESPPAH